MNDYRTSCEANSYNEYVKYNFGDNFYNTKIDSVQVKITDYYQDMLKRNQLKKDKEKYLKDLNHIEEIISKDTSAPKNLDKKDLAAKIMEVSSETGVDYDVIAYICKRETHFNQSKNGKNGKGMMQLTSITIEDMFSRPQAYDENIKPLIRKYGSLEKLFEAKRKDSSIELGTFGELLYKYGSVENCMDAIKKDAKTNLKFGAYCFKEKLKRAKGDLKKALELYNGHPTYKHDYANDVHNNILASRAERTHGEIMNFNV